MVSKFVETIWSPLLGTFHMFYYLSRQSGLFQHCWRYGVIPKLKVACSRGISWKIGPSNTFQITNGTWITPMITHLSLSFTWEKSLMKVWKRHSPPIRVWKVGLKRRERAKRGRGTFAKGWRTWRSSSSTNIFITNCGWTIPKRPSPQEETEECHQGWLFGYSPTYLESTSGVFKFNSSRVHSIYIPSFMAQFHWGKWFVWLLASMVQRATCCVILGFFSNLNHINWNTLKIWFWFLSLDLNVVGCSI